MPRSVSPLRYPGGKTCLHELVSKLLRLNGLQRGHYAEPYAGGSGLALSLLFGGHAHEIHLNDYDLGIWSFWTSVLYHTDELCDLIDKTRVSVDEWLRQREIEANADDTDPLAMGFATFFLNRTNRSGIIKGSGIIGGKEQNGNYKIDCRFNKPVLIEQIKRISGYKDQISLTRLDAIDFMTMIDSRLPDRSLFCIDPPYYKKGSSLYTSFYRPEDHKAVSEVIRKLDTPWILTYDNVPQISELYSDFRQITFDVNYSVQTKRKGTELMVLSEELELPSAFDSVFQQAAA